MHVISVDSCSPAERAGVKAGDVIVEVNISQILLLMLIPTLNCHPVDYSLVGAYSGGSL